MQLETIRALADWLQFGTNGAAGAPNGPSSVNAHMAVIPLDGSDPAPAAIATFGDETRDFWMARRVIPRESGLSYPVLGVVSTDPSDLDGEVGTVIRDGEISATIAYGLQEVVTEDGVRDWLYTSRAIQRSINDWMQNDNAAYRTRGSIAVLECRGIRIIPFYDPRGDLVISGGLSLRLAVRDLAP